MEIKIINSMKTLLKLKGDCKTSGQMRAFNELIRAFTIHPDKKWVVITSQESNWNRNIKEFYFPTKAAAQDFRKDKLSGSVAFIARTGSMPHKAKLAWIKTLENLDSASMYDTKTVKNQYDSKKERKDSESSGFEDNLNPQIEGEVTYVVVGFWNSPGGGPEWIPYESTFDQYDSNKEIIETLKDDQRYYEKSLGRKPSLAETDFLSTVQPPDGAKFVGIMITGGDTQDENIQSGKEWMKKKRKELK